MVVDNISQVNFINHNGNEMKLSPPPNRIEILPEWNSWLCPVHAPHWFGITIENV